ncbi:MAG: hypothetical protein H7330_09640 [Hymenobacteraceae bacterium]|nr:hypothetical protein [Hymenobacteraceae bacterium]
MSVIEKAQEVVSHLTPEQLATFDKWYAEYMADAWDRQIEADVNAGRLDFLIEEAKEDIRAGRVTDL